MTTHLTGALAAIIQDPDCCAASKAIARDALGGCQPRDTEAAIIAFLEREGWADAARHIRSGAYLKPSDAEVDDALAEMVATAQAAGDYAKSKETPA